MKKVLICLDEETDALLRQEAANAGQSLSEYVRRAIAERAGVKPWKAIETRATVEPKSIAKDIRDSLQAFHNRGGK